MQASASRQQQTADANQRAAHSVVLFAKALTASDCCTSVSKGGRITIPRVAVENNLPSVADKKHHEVVALDANDTEWTFVIKSWPNGGENKRVYVMEKTAAYMRRNKMKIGDVIAITRRPDAQLGVESNSAAAIHAVSQGRGRATGCAVSMTAAETIAAQRCVRNSACSKALGHAGFCDNGKSAATLRHNPLAGLAAAAEQASNGSAGYGPAPISPKVRTLAADRPPSSQSPQGILVGKVLTKGDVEHCRVVLPRMAMEANMPEVVNANILHVDLVDDDGSSWPVTLSMSSSGVAKRMFLLEKIGMYIQQHNLQPGDCIAIKRTYDDMLHIVINPDAPANGREASGRESDSLPVTGLVADSADSMDVARRQSVRRRRFKSGCEVNFARMLCGSLKSNGLADPFKNSEDDSFPEEQRPPPLQEHDTTATIAADQLPRKLRQHAAAPSGPVGNLRAGQPHQHPGQQQRHALHQQFHASLPMQFPAFFDLYPAHAQAAAQASATNAKAGAAQSAVDGRGLGLSPQHDGDLAAGNDTRNVDAENALNVDGMLDYHLADTIPPKLASGTCGERDSATQPAVSVAAPTGSGRLSEPVAAAAPAHAAAAQESAAVASAQQLLSAGGSNPYMLMPHMSAALGTTGIMHRPVQYPSGVLPSLFHTSPPPAGMPHLAAAAAAAQPMAAMSGLPSSFPFPPNSSAADAYPPNLYYSVAADAARLYAQQMAPFARAANASLCGPAGLSSLLPTSFAPSLLKTAKPEGLDTAPAAVDYNHVSASAAGEAGRKRKSPGSSQKKGPKGARYGDAAGPVISRRAANRPPPQVPHGSLGKGSGTPKNLARSHVLVAKVLTNSDTHGRIILPRVSVEANLTFLMGYRSYSLPVKDHGGRKWEFVIKSWANGTENRRVYVLEQTGEYLKVNRLGVGDAVGICTNQDGDLVVDSNSVEVRQATVRPTYGAAAVQHVPPPPPGKAQSFANGAPGRCSRSPCCTKFAGHSGFCSGPRALSEGNGAAQLRQEGPEEHTDQLQRRTSAAAAQEEAEDLSAAQEVVAKDMAVGTLVITHLTQQDLRAKEILLPKQAVEANILPALTYPLLKFKVVDDMGKEHEVLLRSFLHEQETMYLLDRLASLLQAVNAQAGDMLMLTREETGPVRVHLESIKYNHEAAGTLKRHSRQTIAAHSHDDDGDEFDDDDDEEKAEYGTVLVCNRTSGCAKSAGHQGFCSGHKGFRRRFFEDMPSHTHRHSSGGWAEYGSGADSGLDDDMGLEADAAADDSRFSGTHSSARNGGGKRKASFQETGPSKRAAMTQEVRVTCGSSSGVYDIRRGCIALRAAQNGQILNLELSPSDFEEHVLGSKQDWRQSLLVEVSEQNHQGLQQALPLGAWLHQHNFAVDHQPSFMAAKPTRFAREAGLEQQPSLSGPLAHNAARVGREVRPSQAVEVASSGRARSLPTLVKPAAHTHLARFASKPVPRAYVPKRARSKAAGIGGRADPPTSQDSLAAEVLLSLCPSGFREMGSDVGEGVVESAVPVPVEAPEQDLQLSSVAEPMQSVDEQVTSCQTERTGSIPLVDSRGFGGMATMDPAGSAVLDQIFDGTGGHMLEPLDIS